jgi:hypothetical protein
MPDCRHYEAPCSARLTLLEIAQQPRPNVVRASDNPEQARVDSGMVVLTIDQHFHFATNAC